MILRFIGYAAVGGILGFGWHRLVGCSSGACPITANPYMSVVWGAAMGAMLALQRPG